MTMPGPLTPRRRAPRTRVVVPAVLLSLAVVGAACSRADLEALPTDVPTSGPTTTVPADTSTPPCDGDPGVGGEVPEGATPGTLVASHRLSPGDSTTKGYPAGATVWRILYVSAGADESDLQLVCGLAAVPEGGPTVDAGRARVLAWSHGTIGLQQACLPSTDPGKHFWGPMPGGIGAVAWGSGLGAHTGPAEGGALQAAMDRGWVVVAADYQPIDTYIIGRIVAANVADAVRAAAQLVAQEHSTVVDTWDTITWGHSQGGHAAIWAGQLFEPWIEATAAPGQPEFRLRGVVGLAPAANLIAEPGQPDVGLDDGLADWAMHQSARLVGLPIPALTVQFGAALLAYIFSSWTQYSAYNDIAPDADWPAYPDTGPLALDAVATDEGSVTIAQVSALCLDSSGANTLKQAVAPYRDAATNRLLVDELWNLPEDYEVGQYFRGAVGRSCATTSEPGLSAWCEWIRWNQPATLGTNPYPKVPASDGYPVPVLLAQGNDDTVVHCVGEDGGEAAGVPAPSECMSTALFDSMRASYCPPTGDTGHLRHMVFPKDGSDSPASHMSAPGQTAAKGFGKSADDLRFDGSPLDAFFTGAFDGTLAPGCTSDVRRG